MTPSQELQNRVLIADKKHIEYANAVVVQAMRFTNIGIMARGNMIGKAVDVTNISLRMLPMWTLRNTIIGDLEQQSNDGKMRFVSFIELWIHHATIPATQ